ncbi:hypothetical protein F5Y16DRAFT_371250 [Xylariaceae sp. FL0255]|nr:hypothetical protein F5Y16DRAFT_371250 [Xylariaceae sp. FL0255]
MIASSTLFIEESIRKVQKCNIPTLSEHSSRSRTLVYVRHDCNRAASLHRIHFLSLYSFNSTRARRRGFREPQVGHEMNRGTAVPYSDPLAFSPWSSGSLLFEKKEEEPSLSDVLSPSDSSRPTDIHGGYYGNTAINNNAPERSPDVAGENERQHHQRKPEYKPTVLQSSFLLLLLAILLTTAALLSYGLKVLPSSSSSSSSQGKSSKVDRAAAIDVPTVAASPEINAPRGTTVAVINLTSTTSTPLPSTTTTATPIKESSPPASDLGSVGSKTVVVTLDSSSEPHHTMTTGNFGSAGSKTVVVEATSTASTSLKYGKGPGNFGSVGSKTVVAEATMATSYTSMTTQYTAPTTSSGGVNSMTVLVTGVPSTTSPTTSLTTSLTTSPIALGNVLSNPSPTVTAEGTTTGDTSGNVSPTRSNVDLDSYISETIGFSTEVTVIVTTVTSGGSASILTTSSTLVVLNPATIITSVTLTNSAGTPTATLPTTETITPSLLAATNSAGTPIGIITPFLITETNSAGKPTATVAAIQPSQNPDPNVGGVTYEAGYISEAEYFAGMFLPTTIASIIALVVRILHTNVKLFQPWHALAVAGESGVLGRDSLCLHATRGGWRSVIRGLPNLSSSLLLPGSGNTNTVVVTLTSLLLSLAAVLVSLSSETISIGTRGEGCSSGGQTAANCLYVLSTSKTASRAGLALLGVMTVVAIVLFGLLSRWRLGVFSNPWSTCTLASLSLDQKVRRLVARGGKMGEGQQMGGIPSRVAFDDSLIRERRFRMGFFYNSTGVMEYGIMTADHDNQWEIIANTTPKVRDPYEKREKRRRPGPIRSYGPFFVLSVVGRLVHLIPICGVLILVLYYGNTGGDTAFEHFIDSDSFGLRFLFTSFGVIISYFWSLFSSAVAVMVPYQLLSQRPQAATRSVLLSHPTNCFSAIWYALRTRHLFLGAVGLASLLSEFLGLFLSTVPYQVAETLLVSQLSIWMSVTILSYMVLLVLGSFCMRWPHMPVDPRSIVGAMYYVCRSPIMHQFTGLGLSVLDKKERDERVTMLGLEYGFGEMGTAKSKGSDSRVGVQVFRNAAVMT